METYIDQFDANPSSLDIVATLCHSPSADQATSNGHLHVQQLIDSTNFSRMNTLEDHWKIVKQIIIYLRETINFRIYLSCHFKSSPLNHIGFCDADWASYVIEKQLILSHLLAV